MGRNGGREEEVWSGPNKRGKERPEERRERKRDKERKEGQVGGASLATKISLLHPRPSAGVAHR